jgi:transcriptional regulator with XRE-family HTH domain
MLNRLRSQRLERGWSQQALAQRTGLSRAEISAIETRRVVPSTQAALLLVHALGVGVEDVFALDGAPQVDWAWAPVKTPSRAWLAEVRGRRRLFPCEKSPIGLVEHDALVEGQG